MYQTFRHVLIAFIPYTLVLIAMRVVGYIDLSVTLRVYLPLFLLGSSPLVFGKPLMGYIFLAFSSMGLIAEYLIYSSDPEAPFTQPMMANAIFLLMGVVVSAGTQFLLDQRRKRKLRQ